MAINAAAPVDPDKTIRIARFFSYPKEVLYFLASFIAFVSICHYCGLFYTVIKNRAARSRTQRSNTPQISRIPAAIADVFRTLAFRWVIPLGPSYYLNLAEVFLTAAYTAILLTWTFIDTTTTTGIKVEPHYYANRAGTMAASQLPIITALGMRNNIFSLLTGVSFDKLNYLHRMSSRVLVILVWVHAGGRLKVGLLGDEAITNHWVQCGFLAASTLTVLCLVTIRPIRQKSYEVFIVVHFILAFMFLIGAYFHLRGRSLVYYGVWPSFIVWGLDRFLRWLRILVFNFGYFKSGNLAAKELDAQVDVLTPQFIRVTVHRKAYLHWRPGQCVFLCFPGVSKMPFETHPFTISTIDDSENSSDKKLVFLVRVRDGLTKRLLNSAGENQNHKVFVDGPYGSPPLLFGFRTAILIAGGSGVSFTLPLLLGLLREANRGPISCQKILFVWAIREPDHIQWISDLIVPALANISPSVEVDIQIFTTTNSIDAQSWEDDSSEDTLEDKALDNRSDSQTFDSPVVRVQQGRPNLDDLIKREISTATGDISVNVCGTQALTLAVRTAIRTPRPLDILRGGPAIFLHVEAFGKS